MNLKSMLNAVLQALGFAKKKGWIDKTGQVRRPDNSAPPGSNR